ncbi:lactaldehyde reductase [Amedibacillus sp. YH-ame6]
MKRFILNETSYHGYGAIEGIILEIKQRNFKKALIVTDEDLVKFKVINKVTDLMDKEGFPYVVYDGVKANPTVDMVKEGVAIFAQNACDYLIAIGGGSPQDTAKGIGIITNNPEFGDVLSLEGTAETKHKSVPMIAVATTAGTAAETTINYVITDTEKRRKFVCVDPHDIPVVAVVDPDMMSSMPKGLSAATGMDALTHAIEGYITKDAWELSDTLNLKAIELIAKHLGKACENDPVAREAMALGQYMTGMAFSNVGLGIVHSMAHALGAYYNTPHGIANAVLLPYVMEFNKDATNEKYRDIAYAMGVENCQTMDSDTYRKVAIKAVKELSTSIGIPQTLSEINVLESDLKELSELAYKDVCTGGNPRECSVADILAIYQSAMGK